MEAQQVKMKFKQQQLGETHHQSMDMKNLVDSSPMIKQRWLKTKKRMVTKKPSNLKSKAKQEISDDRGKSGSCKKRRTRIEDLYNNDEAKFSVMDRAEEILDNVADEFPSFIKCMLPSNVTHGFWLILPKKFCNLHLPMHDSTVILVDDCGKEYEANFLVERHGLSGGWRGFSLAHRLLKGDILVFQLIKRCTLKVHIVRVYGLDEVDAALCLMNLVVRTKRTYSNKNTKTRKKAKKSLESLLLDIPRKNSKKNGPTVQYSKHGLVADCSETYSDSFGSEVLEGSEIYDHQAHELSCSQNPTLDNRLLGASIVDSQLGKSPSLLKVHAIGAADKLTTFPILQVET